MNKEDLRTCLLGLLSCILYQFLNNIITWISQKKITLEISGEIVSVMVLLILICLIKYTLDRLIITKNQ